MVGTGRFQAVRQCCGERRDVEMGDAIWAIGRQGACSGEGESFGSGLCMDQDT